MTFITAFLIGIGGVLGVAAGLFIVTFIAVWATSSVDQ